ncbi:MAG: hypothetical protein P4L43_14215 [Syntrophobacteraceae bacterium]|nr:hypothetical protein [Syntrophobacteraceae bacterium]
MPEFTEYLQEKLEWAADRIREFLTGSKGCRVAEVKERTRNVFPGAGVDPVFPPDDPCNKY